MAQCRQCGGEVAEGAKFCTWCGSLVAGAVASSAQPVQEGRVWGGGVNPSPAQPAAQPTYVQPTYVQPAAQPTPNSAASQPTTPGKIDGLGIAALAFLGFSALMNVVYLVGALTNVSGLGADAFTIIAYVCMSLIPVALAVLLYKKLTTGQPISLALKIVTLFFGNLIAGILLLIRK